MKREIKKLIALFNALEENLDESSDILTHEIETGDFQSEEREINERKLQALLEEIISKKEEKKEVIRYEQGKIIIFEDENN